MQSYVIRYTRGLHRLPTILLTTLLLLLTSCVHDDVDERAEDGSRKVPVSFEPYLMQQKASDMGTRAVVVINPENTGGVLMTTEELKKWGFGVFAKYHGNDSYYRTKPFDFMFNQKVTWEEDKTDYITRWTYQPLKYWPNDNDPADDQDNDTGLNPATGSGEYGGKITFFAYAPYQQYNVVSSSLVPIGTGDRYGITDMPSNTSEAYLIYQSQMKPGQDVDLLWAKQDELYKTKLTGEGYTTGCVPFVFQHALSRLGITVMGLFDHVSPSDEPWEGYSDDVDDNTRILIESVTIEKTNIPDHGRMYIAPKVSASNTAYDISKTSAYWEVDRAAAINISPSDANFNHRLVYTAGKPTNQVTSEDALTELGTLPLGVDKVERWLYYGEDAEHNEQPLYYLFPPNNNSPSVAHNPLKVNIKYHVITYDPRLTLNTPKYFSIVENDITAEFSNVITFEPNKEYRLRLLLGLTSVKFEVVDVTDWEVPIVLGAVVKEWRTETHEYNVE